LRSLFTAQAQEDNALATHPPDPDPGRPRRSPASPPGPENSPRQPRNPSLSSARADGILPDWGVHRTGKPSSIIPGTMKLPSEPPDRVAEATQRKKMPHLSCRPWNGKIWNPVSKPPAGGNAAISCGWSWGFPRRRWCPLWASAGRAVWASWFYWRSW
jgi:hypothetical protein